MSDAALQYVKDCRHPQVTQTARALLDAIARLIPEGETTTPSIGMRDLATSARMHQRTVWRWLTVLVDIGELRVVDGLPGRPARYTLVHLAGVGPVTAAPLPLVGAAAPRRARTRVATPASTNARLDFDPPIDLSERREGDQPIIGIIGWASRTIIGIVGRPIVGIIGIIGWAITRIIGITGWWRSSEELLKTKRSASEEPTIATYDPYDPLYRDRARDVVVERSRSEVVGDAHAREPADEFLEWFERTYPTAHHGAVYTVLQTRDGPLVRELLQRPRTDVAHLQAMTRRLWAIETDGVVNSDRWWIAVKVTVRGIVVLHRKADFLDQEVRREGAPSASATNSPTDPVAGGDVWADVLRVVDVKVSRHAFFTWFVPTALVEDRGHVIVIAGPSAPDDLFADYVEKNYGDVVREAVEAVRPGARVEFRRLQRKSG